MSKNNKRGEHVSIFPKSEPEEKYYHLYFCSTAELEASYERCRALGVPAELEEPRITLEKAALNRRLLLNRPLVSVTEQIIIPFYYLGVEVFPGHYQPPLFYILCDSELVALKVFASPYHLAVAKKTWVKPGIVLTEESCGTNALALAREHDRLVATRGEQHFCQMFRDWWCVASPVKDVDGFTVGYLNISLSVKLLGDTVLLLRTHLDRIKEDLLFVLDPDRAWARRAASGIGLVLKAQRELSPREREVFSLLIHSDRTSREIAEELQLKVSTVKTYRRRIYQKLGVKNMAELRAWYQRR
uniref:Helix-turn-helix transcriptional regulator n=1 Tax=Ammonifex degensii TaxID=42838 RepID=A0A7C2I0U0_9THEO